MLFSESNWRWVLLSVCAASFVLALSMFTAQAAPPPGAIPDKGEKLGPAIDLGPQTPPKGSPGPITPPQAGPRPPQHPHKPGGKVPRAMPPRPGHVPAVAPRQHPYRPFWLPERRPLAPVIPAARPLPETVVVGGTTLVVENPSGYPVMVPPRIVVVPRVSHKDIPDSAQSPSGGRSEGAKVQDSAEGPLVQFGRLVDHRLRELYAFEMQGHVSQANITRTADGKWSKAYFRFPVQSVHIEIASTMPPEFIGEIDYDRVLYVQTADNREEVVQQVGNPLPDMKPVRSIEKYAYRNGNWVFIEE